MTHQNNQKSEPTPAVRLIRKEQVLRIAGDVSYVTVWCWMQAGTFPRARKVGGQTMWLSTDIDEWLANLPIRRIKGDRPGFGAGAGAPDQLLRSMSHTTPRKGEVGAGQPTARRTNKDAA
jgi:predicted DNA-binding transcriptional regulator AlpA